MGRVGIMKKFGPSDYYGLAKYWLTMPKFGENAECRATKIIGHFAKKSRFHCTYDLLYSYDTVVGKRVGEGSFIISDRMYSATTRTQLGNIYYLSSILDFKFVSAPIPQNGITPGYMISTLSGKLSKLKDMQKSILSSRKKHTREAKTRRFYSAIDEIMLLITFYYDEMGKKKHGRDAKIVSEIKVDSNIDDALKEIERIYKRRIRDRRYSKKLSKAKEVGMVDGIIILSHGRRKIDSLTLAMASGILNIEGISIQETDFSEKTIRGRRYYVYKDELIDAKTADKLMMIYYADIIKKENNGNTNQNA